MLVVLLYPLSYLMSARAATPVALAICVVVLTVAAFRRRRAARAGDAGLREALVPSRYDLAVALVAAGAGVAFLAPVIATGLPTILAITNNDAWYYAGVVEWLTTHSAGSAVVPSLAQPLEASVTIMKQSSLPFGFELVATSVGVLSAHEPYAVLATTASVGAYAAVSGWVRLAEVLTGRRRPLAVAAAVAASSPMLLLTFGENYLTHFMGLALLPIGLALATAYFREPTGRTLAAAAVSSAGLVGVYVGVLPWQILLTLAAAVTAAGSAPAWGRRVRRGGRLVACLLLLVPLAVAAAAVNPIGTYRAYAFSTLASGFTDDGPFLSYGRDVYVGLVSGAIHSASSGVGAVALLGVAVVAVAALVAATGRRLRPAPVPLALELAVLLATAAVFVNYDRSGYAYGTYKTATSGGAVLAGVVVVGLVARAQGRRATALSTALIGLCAAVWVPGAVAVMRDASASRPGFREDDIALGRALRDLPAGARVLVEGADAGGSPDQFQLRMMTAYFLGTSSGFTASGLWSTPSYISPGPLPQFRPSAPWDYVLTARPSPFGAGRAPVWRRGPFRLTRAPVLDVTEYGPRWYAPERDARGWFQWLSGPAELVVANRSAQPRRARLRMVVQSYARARTVRLTSGDATSSRRSPAHRQVVVGLELTVPPQATRLVALDASPDASPAPPGDPRQLSLRLRDVHVVPIAPPRL